MQALPFIVFVILALFVVRAPLGWAVVSLILLAHLDLSLLIESPPLVVIVNTIRVTILPLAMAVRFKLTPGRPPSGSNAWLALYLVWGVSLIPGLLTSSDVGSSLRFTVYIGTMALLIAIWREILRRELLKTGHLIVLTVAPALFATAQTFWFGNMFGTADGRFTSFGSPQAFGIYYVLIIGIIMSISRSRVAIVVGLSMSVSAVLLSGSRTSFLGLLIVCGFALIGQWSRRPARATIISICATVAALLLALNSSIIDATGRISQLVGGIAGASEIGTFIYRGIVRAEVFAGWQHADGWGQWFGSGNSASARIIAPLDSRYDVGIDANRVTHNEFLRVLYEHGLAAVLVMVVLLLALLLYCVRNAPLTVVGALCFLMISMGFENVLVSATAPSGQAVAATLAAAMVLRRNYRRGSEYRASRGVRG